MNVFRIFDRRTSYILAAITIVLAVFISIAASAAQVTQRSIELSSSSVSATSVAYNVDFTSAGAAEAFVIDFCSNSPVVGQDCTPPTGFTAENAASVTSGFTGVSDIDDNTIIVEGTIAATTAISVDLTAINNPTVAGPLYARIVTFDTPENAALYVSNPVEPATNVGIVDEGSVAISINPTIGVSGAVLESLTFCVTATVAPTANCANAAANPPILALGEPVGGTVALNAGVVSEGSLYTQVSTNASSGVVVRLKSSTDCGGLKRAGAAVCDIVPALTGDIAAGEARFGVKTATATDVGAGATGTFQAVTGSGYNDTTFAFNYLANNNSGVTSTFGDPFLDTAGLPANNKNMELTFGASISNNTPAGQYATSLSMIATGRF